MRVTLVQRGKGEFWSLEGIFETVARHLPEGVEAEMVCAPERGGRPGVVWRNWVWARSLRGEVFHVTGDIHYAVLGLRGAPRILTVHDVRLVEEARGMRRFLLWLLWLYLPGQAAEAVTAISDETKEKLVQVGRIPREKIRVIPNPVSPRFQAVPKPWDEAKPALLQVGTTENKNLERVVEACRGLEVRLWVLGRLSEGQRKMLEGAEVEFESFADLAWGEVVRLYERCDAVVFPSLYEGFGMPILEGQAVGRPVLTSDRAPMREVAGGGALLVDPEEVGSIQQGLERLLVEPELRAELVDKGFANVRRYTAEAVAARYAALYREVGG